MSKKEVCLNNEVVGSWSIWGYYALEVHHIEYGIDEYFYCHSTFEDTYHKLKVYISLSGRPYIIFKGRRYYTDECELLPIG